MTATPHFLDCITIADSIARSECDEAIQLLCLDFSIASLRAQ